MANTGYILPQSAASVAESPWTNANGAWQSPTAIYGAGEALITDNSWDSGEYSEVLKAYNFDLSAIPSGSVITGVICKVNARCTASATMNINLVQILDVSRAKVGTNMASSPTGLTSTATDYTWGASNNLWGNSLTESWVKDADFGVAIGVISGTNNADVWIDAVSIDVYYTPPANFTPGLGEVTLTGYAPTVFASDNKNVSPGTGEITLTGYAPTVTIAATWTGRYLKKHNGTSWVAHPVKQNTDGWSARPMKKL